MKAIDSEKAPSSTNPAPVVKYTATESRKGVTGFFDIVPQRPDLQEKYDAMSESWQKVEPTDPEVLQGLFGSPLQGKTPIKK